MTNATVTEALSPSEQDHHWMQLALQAAAAAAERGEVPVGAVLVKDQQLIMSSHNQPILRHDPTAHAEINVLRAAGEILQNYRLVDTTLYVTLEPCAMCVGAIAHARVSRVVYAASDPKAGAVAGAVALAESAHFNHHPDYVAGVCAKEAGDLLRAFFQARR